jgi:hypothetical protein
MSSYPKAQLCKHCEGAFSSHWIAKDSIELNDSDDDASFSEYFYEAPDWVTLVNADDATSQPSEGYRSPPHHNLAQLEQSAHQGCYLCTIFFDKVRDGMENLSTDKKATSSRLRSFLIARPNYDDSFGGEIVQLEISYFIDGLIKPDTFALTVGVILYQLLRKLSSYDLELLSNKPNY